MRCATILVLEDEPTVLALIRTVLEREGYHVLGAADAETALRACRDAAQPIGAMVADVMARGSFAGITAREIFARRPGVPILLISGHALQDLIERKFIDPGNLALGRVRFLQKPFRLDVLRDEVRRMLKGKSAAASQGG